MILISNWLKNKLRDRENGIIFDSHDLNSFGLIQEFIEDHDCQFKTPVIYYQAFPEESAVDFLDTLGAELTSKLTKGGANPKQSLPKTIKDAELKMIVIDKCHLHPKTPCIT